MDKLAPVVIRSATFIDIGDPSKLQEIASRMSAEAHDAEKTGKQVMFALTEEIVLYFNPRKKAGT